MDLMNFCVSSDGVVLLGSICWNSTPKRRAIFWEGKWRFIQKGHLSQ